MGLIHHKMNTMKRASSIKKPSGEITYDEASLIEPVSNITKNDVTRATPEGATPLESRLYLDQPKYC